MRHLTNGLRDGSSGSGQTPSRPKLAPVHYFWPAMQHYSSAHRTPRIKYVKLLAPCMVGILEGRRRHAAAVYGEARRPRAAITALGATSGMASVYAQLASMLFSIAALSLSLCTCRATTLQWDTNTSTTGTAGRSRRLERHEQLVERFIKCLLDRGFRGYVCLRWRHRQRQQPCRSRQPHVF